MNILSFIEGTKDFFIQNGTLGLFVISFTEASFFPIPPDIVLLSLSILMPEKALYYAFVTSIGSILGGVFGYFLGKRAGRPLLLRFMKEDYIKKSEQMFSKYGGWAVAIAGFTPIPYKVFTLASGVFYMDFSTFVIATILSRSARFVLEGIIVMSLGEKALDFINKFLGPFSYIIIGSFILLYIFFKRIPINIRVPFNKPAFSNLKSKTQKILSSYGEFGIYLLAGFSISITLGVLFFKLATEVLQRELEGFDNSMINFLKYLHLPLIDPMTRIINFMQNPYVFIGLFLLCLIFVKLISNKAKHIFMTFVTFIGTFLLQLSFKSLYKRPGIMPGKNFLDYSFPSGYISVFAGISGYIIFILMGKLKAKQKYKLIFSWIIFLGIISISRIYAGISYPSDVLAGILLGGTWLSVCIVATKALEHYEDR